jgi:hypothetical protein
MDKKELYEAPSTSVLEVNAESVICDSGNQAPVLWLLSGDDFSSTTNWGRSGYGTADEF